MLEDEEESSVPEVQRNTARDVKVLYFVHVAHLDDDIINALESH